MARFTTLSTLRSMLKAEIGHSLSVGTQQDTMFNTLLSNKQKWLASEYDWPFLEDRWDATVTTRYTAMPTTAAISGSSTNINFERPIRVETKWNYIWYEVPYGIGREQYNYLDSDRGITADPIQRWQWYQVDDGTTNQFEVWPVPVTSQTVRFRAQRALMALSVDADKADLDDLLVVLFVAAEILANSDLPNAQIVLARAEQRLARLRGAYPDRQRLYVVGSGSEKGAVRIVPMKIVTTHG